MELFRITPPAAPVPIELDNMEEGSLTHITVGEKSIPIEGSGPEILQTRKTDKGVVLVRDVLVQSGCYGGYEHRDQCLAVITAGTYTCLSESVGVDIIARGGTDVSLEILAVVVRNGTFFARSKYTISQYCWDGTKWITKHLEEEDAHLDLEEIKRGAGMAEWDHGHE